MLLAIIAEFRLYGRQLADEYLHTLGEECYGSIYSNLKRLRAGGHIAPAKLTPAEQKRIPRSAKVYELTPKGQKLLRTMQQMFETRIAGAGSRAA